MADFDSCIIVDWSASNNRKTGRDSIWYCLLRRERGKLKSECRNPSTRHEATNEIASLLAENADLGLRTLVGFDFPYGYPAGLAGALGLKGDQPWRAVWNKLSRRIKDGPDNRNNRFCVAGDLNERISGRPAPFWGRPANYEKATLSARRPEQCLPILGAKEKSHKDDAR